MKFGKMRPTATIVAQYTAGVEVESIEHDGKIYLPIATVPQFEDTVDDEDEHDAPATKTKKEKPAPSKKDEAPAAAATKQYTEDEMMDMESKELEKILKKEYGIDPDDFEGKNTNKKLRKLILDAQAKAAAKPAVKKEEPEDDDDEDDTKGKPAKGGDDLASKVGDLLEEFDAGKRNKKKTIAAICALAEDADQDKVTELVDQFESDTDADLDEIAEDIASVLNGEEDDEEDKKPAKKSSKKGGKKDEKLVAVEDLEVGDRVSVYWDDDNKDWFDGEVKSIKRGKVTIAYDDDTEDVIDPEIHTKIRRI